MVVRHRNLTQKALRNEATLLILQNQIKQFEVGQSCATSPWEMISTPILFDAPVSPRRGRTLAIDLLAGLMFGSTLRLFVTHDSFATRFANIQLLVTASSLAKRKQIRILTLVELQPAQAQAINQSSLLSELIW